MRANSAGGRVLCVGEQVQRCAVTPTLTTPTCAEMPEQDNDDDNDDDDDYVKKRVGCNDNVISRPLSFTSVVTPPSTRDSSNSRMVMQPSSPYSTYPGNHLNGDKGRRSEKRM